MASSSRLPSVSSDTAAPWCWARQCWARPRYAGAEDLDPLSLLLLCGASAQAQPSSSALGPACCDMFLSRTRLGTFMGDTHRLYSEAPFLLSSPLGPHQLLHGPPRPTLEVGVGGEEEGAVWLGCGMWCWWGGRNWNPGGSG